MSIEKHLKQLLIHQLRQRLSRVKQDLETLSEPPPDAKIISYGIVVGYLDIVTEKEIDPERLSRWKSLVSQGSKLIIIVSKEEKLKITDLLWKEGLAEKVSVGTYEINLFLP